MQKPSIGRVVIVPSTALSVPNNGAEEAPAIITRVFSDTLVNVRVLADGNDTPWLTSVTLHETKEALAGSGQCFGCYWPARV